MEKIKRFFSSDPARQLLGALLLFGGAYATLPASGAFSAFAIPVFAGFFLALFYDEWWFCLAGSALFSFLLALSAFDRAALIAVSCVAVTLTSLGGLFTCRAFKRAWFQKKKSSLFVGLFGLLGCFAVGFLLFGNPVSYFQSRTQALHTLESRYPVETFQLEESRYEPRYRCYVTTASYLEKGVRFTAEVDPQNPAGDTYFDAICDAAAASKKDAFLSLLHEHFPQTTYAVTVDTSAISRDDVVFYTVGDTPEEWNALYAYTVEFGFSVNTEAFGSKNEFAALCASYLRVLKETGFPYRAIEFRAGEQGVMKFALSVPAERTPESLSGTEITVLSQ